jgi:hypothetical protein
LAAAPGIATLAAFFGVQNINALACYWLVETYRRSVGRNRENNDGRPRSEWEQEVWHGLFSHKVAQEVRGTMAKLCLPGKTTVSEKYLRLFEREIAGF